MKLVNATAQTIALIDSTGTVTYYAPAPVGRHAGISPREMERIPMRGRCPTWVSRSAIIVGLPEPQADTYYLVDSGTALLASQELPQRWDLLTVDPETATVLPGDPYQIAYRHLVAYDRSALVQIGCDAIG